MKQKRIALNILLLLLIASYVAYRLMWRAVVVYSSTSPDGMWRCDITDIDPSPYQVTLVYSLHMTGRDISISGTQYISYEDSALPDEVNFEWFPNRVLVRHKYQTVVGDFSALPLTQSWRKEPAREGRGSGSVRFRRGFPSRMAVYLRSRFQGFEDRINRIFRITGFRRSLFRAQDQAAGFQGVTFGNSDHPVPSFAGFVATCVIQFKLSYYRGRYIIDLLGGDLIASRQR